MGAREQALEDAARLADEWDSGWGEDRNTKVARQTALEIAAAIRVLTASSAPAQEPVAYRIKDFADGWMFTGSASTASTYKAAGHIVEPLYASPAQGGMNVSEALRKRFARYLAPAYLNDDVKIAALCDEELDPTGNLLGFVREEAAALRRALGQEPPQ